MSAIHAPMATGLPYGVTEATIGPEPPRASGRRCDCGCGEIIEPGYEHYKDSFDNVYADTDCILRFFEIERVH